VLLSEVVDVVVVGGGVNGLVVVVMLVDCGWDVVLFEVHELGGVVCS